MLYSVQQNIIEYIAFSWAKNYLLILDTKAKINDDTWKVHKIIHNT